MNSIVWKIFRGPRRARVFNWFPAFRGTGGRVTYLAENFREIRISIPGSAAPRRHAAPGSPVLPARLI